jgi:hypothetical protein
VQVVDQGPGIPAEEQAVVFERFRRGHGVAAGGVGLGLYIAQAYVQAMGGQIGVRSAPGHGATFWVRLPRMRPADDADPSQTSVASDHSSGVAGDNGRQPADVPAPSVTPAVQEPPGTPPAGQPALGES